MNAKFCCLVLLAATPAAAGTIDIPGPLAAERVIGGDPLRPTADARRHRLETALLPDPFFTRADQIMGWWDGLKTAGPPEIAPQVAGVFWRFHTFEHWLAFTVVPEPAMIIIGLLSLLLWRALPGRALPGGVRDDY